VCIKIRRIAQGGEPRYFRTAQINGSHRNCSAALWIAVLTERAIENTDAGHCSLKQEGQMFPSGETFPMREGARDAKRRGRKGAKNDKRKMKNEKIGAVTLR